MWRLSRLDIKGFKSFAEPAELVFPEGITAVVGPNGCGKSNISDAIVWALGEQSTSALRAQKMQDVIFQGSAGRKPTPLAEVTLHLTTRPPSPGLLEGNGNGHPAAEANGNGSSGAGAPGNGNGLAPTPVAHAEGDPLADLDGPQFDDEEMLEELDQELRITRRLYRSGDSEYLMNGESCLLRDIRERLLGTGLGFRACFNIGQGRIDQLLSASPVERRVPIEEAAGISLYRRRRHRTKLKLEATAQDLSRVDDICQEVARQMRSLKRQAGRAKRYRKLRDRLRGLERRWFALRLEQTERATTVARAALEASRLGEEEGRENLERSTAAWETARRVMREHRQRFERQRQQVYDAQVEHERSRAEAARLRDRAAFASDRVKEVRQRLEETESRRGDAAEVVEARREAAAQAEESARTAARIHHEAADRLDPLLHLEEQAREQATQNREKTLEILPLAARIEVSEEHRPAVALVLGARLRQPLMAAEEVAPWLDAVTDRRGVTRGLRETAATPVGGELDEPGVVGRLTDVIAARDDAAAAVVADLTRDVWIAESRESVLELAQRHAAHGFVDIGGSAWARGSEIVLRNEAVHSDEIAESSGRALKLKITEDGPEPEPRSALPSPEIESARVEVERAETALRAARAQAAAAQREARSAEANLRQIETEGERQRREIELLEATAKGALEKAAESDRLAESAQKRRTGLEEDLAREDRSDVSEEAELLGLEAAVSSAREALERSQARRSGAEVQAAEVRVERQHLQGQIRERLDLEPRELARQMRAEAEERAAAAQDGDVAPTESPLAPVELQRRIREVRDKIERLGPVNLVAYEDFKKQETRFEDIDGQRRDLLGAAKNLQEAIRKIDEECVKRFAEAFEAIDGYFNRIFRQLFGGGRAGMRLENPDDPLGSGIEIMAQPPGKTLQSIRLMSGGERSLIALALMFAIFEYHPAPFCILDEADAALDERNVGRFVQALHHFQDRAQFIMITHNKRSMEIADLLYGVTMEESGVSKLVSVELN